MNPFRITSLQKRFSLYLLLPVAFLLFAVGFVGFLYARNTMLEGWREAAILKLQRAAHHIDMRLSRPLERIDVFHKTGSRGEGSASPKWILRQIRELKGVTNVELKWTDKRPEQAPMRGHGSRMGESGMMRFHHAKTSKVTLPRYDTQTGQETVSIISELINESGRTVGVLEVALRFDYLLEDIQRLGWWQGDKACLTDDAGRYLIHTKAMMNGRNQLGETNDPLELAILDAMKGNSSGTLLGPGHPPEVVAGFYKLERAPWAIILFAPGEKILAPIVRFRLYYFVAGIGFILLILFLIRSVVGKQVRAIRDISGAALKVAKGEYGEPLVPNSHDEIGRLTRSFNEMVSGLKEKDFISNTFGRYVDQEIARELMRRPEASSLGGQKREVIILMSDLRDFTPLSESLSPEETIRILNRYFSTMIDVIPQHRGILVDFLGDALLVFFDPLDGPVEPSIKQAIMCALEMQMKLEDLNLESMAEGLPVLHMGIGVNGGEVVVGNIGSDTRAKYGIVGAPVNLTHRIQSVAKAGEVVISGFVRQQAPDGIAVKKSFSEQLKGLREPTELHVIESFRYRT